MGSTGLLTQTGVAALADRATPPRRPARSEHALRPQSVATAAMAWRQIQARPPGSSGPASRNTVDRRQPDQGHPGHRRPRSPGRLARNGFRPAASDGPIVERMIAGIIRDRTSAAVTSVATAAMGGRPGSTISTVRVREQVAVPLGARPEARQDPGGPVGDDVVERGLAHEPALPVRARGAAPCSHRAGTRPTARTPPARRAP